MSLPIPDVIDTLRSAGLPADLLIKIENELEAKEQEAAAEREGAAPKVKNETALLVIDQEGKLAALGLDLVGLSVQVAEGTDLSSIPERIAKASYDQNASGKRKRWNIKTMGEAPSIKRKHLKEVGARISSGKQVVRVLIVPNDIPAA